MCHPPGVTRAVEPLGPRRPVVGVVEPVALGPDEAGPRHGCDEARLVGLPELGDPELEVDDVLRHEPRHGRGADVVEGGGGPVDRMTDPGEQARGLRGPRRVGRRQGGV